MGDKHLARAEAAARWFLSVQQEDGVIPYEFDYQVGGMGPGVSLEPVWASALAQGELLSLLARLYEETGNEAYKRAGDAAIQPLSVPVARGGLRQELPDDRGMWFEEYPSDPPSFVLNGQQFALIGLHDWAEVTGSLAARELYEEGLDSLVAALELFDGQERSAYHLGHLTADQPVYASDWYHMVNTRNLLWLSILEPDESALAEYRDRWQGYPDCQTPKGQIICFTIR